MTKLANGVGMKGSQEALFPDKHRELEKSINTFRSWLQKRKRLCVDASDRYTRLTFPEPTAADWIMNVNGGEVQFNTFITNECTFDFYRMIVLHECFHLFVQDVPNKSDAKRVKDDFGDRFMKLLDIEADYYTAMFYKEVEHASLVDIFALFHEGSRIFGDPKIRIGKVERFIGAVLSIASSYFRNPSSRPTKETQLFLPNIGNIPMEESIHILILRSGHFLVGEIHADLSDLASVKRCYTQVGEMGVRSYVDTLLRFSSKALREDIPPVIYKQFLALRGDKLDRSIRRPSQGLLLCAPKSGSSSSVA
jgi:hypothetical protein